MVATTFPHATAEWIIKKTAPSPSIHYYSNNTDKSLAGGDDDDDEEVVLFTTRDRRQLARMEETLDRRMLRMEESIRMLARSARVDDNNTRSFAVSEAVVLSVREAEGSTNS